MHFAQHGSHGWSQCQAVQEGFGFESQPGSLCVGFICLSSVSAGLLQVFWFHAGVQKHVSQRKN